MPFQLPCFKSQKDVTPPAKKKGFSLSKRLASLLRRSPKPPVAAQDPKAEAKTSAVEQEPSDKTTANAQSSPEGTGVMPRSQLQLEQFAKRMAMSPRYTSMSLLKSLGSKNSSEIEEEKEDSEDDTEADAWAQFSISEVAQYVPALNYQLPKVPKFSLPSLSLPARSPSTEGFEDVYIVLRPINFKHSSRELLQRIGQATDMAELQSYLLFQHWGVKVGNHYYHLHIVEEERDDGSKTVRQKLAVSLSDFDQHTLKVPIWQTGKTHEERVMSAISVIRAMGGFKKEDEVQVYADHSGLKEHVIPDDERQKYCRKVGGRRFMFVPFSGEYNAVVNSCINFSANYLIYHILDINPFATTAADFKRKMTWLAQKWVTSGCKLNKDKLIEIFTSPLGLLNPMRVLTRTGDGNIFLVRLLLVFMGKIRPDGAEAVETSPDIHVVSEGDVKAVAPQVEKDADAEIAKLKA